MIDIKNIADECCRLLTSLDGEYYSYRDDESLYRRLRFDVYTSLLNMGFVIDEVIAFPYVLANTPEEYYFCEPNLVDSFHVSAQTLRNSHKVISPILLSIINHKLLSVSDKTVLRSVLLTLPMTPTQINNVLISNGVINSPISYMAIISLFEMVGADDIQCWLGAKYTARDTGQKRAARFSRPTVPVLFDSNTDKKQIISYVNKLVRAAEKISSTVGFVDLNVLSKVSPLKKFSNNVEPLKNFLKSYFAEREEFIDFGNNVVIANVDDSDFIRRMWSYVNALGSAPIEIASSFLLRCINYKAYLSQQGLEEHNKNLQADSFSTKFRTADYELDKVDNSFVLELIDSSSLLAVDKRRNAIIKTSELDTPVSEMFWVDYYLQFRAQPDFKQYENISNNIDAFSDYIINIYNEKIDYCLTYPNGFFEIHNGIVHVSNENKEHAKNHRGEYIQPDANIVDEKLHTVYMQYKEFEDLTESNYEAYGKAFIMEYKDKTASQVKNYFLPDFKQDLFTWLSRSPLKVAESMLTANISKFTTMLNNIDARIKNNYQLADVLKVSNARSIESLETRRIEVNLCLAVCNELLEQIQNTEVAVKTREFESKMQSLRDDKKSLRIRSVDFKYYLLLHDLLVEYGSDIALEEFKEMLSSYVESLKTNTGGKQPLIRIVAHRIISLHPFSI